MAGTYTEEKTLFPCNRQKKIEPAINIKNVGPISTNGGPDAESSLDIQFGGTVARGAESYFWVDLTWM